ncbi:MAG: YDG domain-containing protein, partial [Clostridiales bacterium]|nr:YDG domain-containing protein [Clostridiales bacterium]
PATLTITGGTITGTTSDGIYAQGNYSQVIIYDGIVSGETNGVRINGGQELLEISGGTFSGKDDSVIVSNSYASGAITGGTFNTDVGEYLKNSDGTESGSTYVLLANSDGTYTAMTETNAKTVAGTYVIYTDDENEEYTIYYDSVSSVSDVEVKVAGYSVEYDGEEHTITVTVTSPADAVVTYSTDGTTYSSTLPTYTNAGTYTIYYKIKSSNGTVYGSETVTISVKALSENDFTVDTEDEAYTGSAITKTITSDLVENADYTVSHADNTVAGTATITITGIGNCSGTLTYTFTINKKSVTPSISGMTSKTYDGTTDVTDEQGISIALDGVAVGDDVSATASFAYDSAAVSTDKTITATGIILSGEDAGNYDLSSAIATTTGSITQKALSQSDFTVDTDGVTYTGSAITKGITSDLVKDTDYTVTYNDNINAGTATITITGKGNYSGTLTYNFTINSKSVTASISGDTKKTYDGTTDVTAAQGLSITLDGVADGDNVTASASYTYNSVDAEEGKTITASGITLTGDDVGNYTLSNTTATTGGSITTRTLGESDFTVDTTAETYTGFAITKAVSSTGSLVEGTDYTISYSSDNTNAGTVTITLTGSGNCTGTLTYNFTINKATPTVSLTGVESKNYNGTAVSDPTVSVTLVGSEEYSGTPTVTYYSVADDGTETALSSAPVDVGNYKVVVEVDAGRNYTTATAEAAFSIFAAEQDVTIEGFTDVVYDGQTHEVTVTTDADATVTVTYTDADGNTVAAPVNAGTYTAHVTVTRDNYATVEEDVTVSIAQAAQSISYDTTSVTKTVGDDAFTNKLTQTTVYGTITYTSSDISVAAVDSYGQVTIVGAGTAIITATVSGSDNYASATASYTLTVSEDSDNSSTENDISSNDSSSSTSDGSNSDSSSTNSTSNPETGDTTNIALWVVIMLLAASGITVTTIYGRKRRYNK